VLGLETGTNKHTGDLRSIPVRGEDAGTINLVIASEARRSVFYPLTKSKTVPTIGFSRETGYGNLPFTLSDHLTADCHAPHLGLD